jgi:hypothetical protein
LDTTFTNSSKLVRIAPTSRTERTARMIDRLD